MTKIEKKEVFFVGSHPFDTKEEAEAHVKRLREEEIKYKRRLKAKAERDKKVVELNKLIKEEHKKKDEYYKAEGRYQRELRKLVLSNKNQFISLRLTDVNNKINDFNTQIKKLQLAIKICRSSMVSQRKEALKAWNNSPEFSSLTNKRKAATSAINRSWDRINDLETKRDKLINQVIT